MWHQKGAMRERRLLSFEQDTYRMVLGDIRPFAFEARIFREEVGDVAAMAANE